MRAEVKRPPREFEIVLRMTSTEARELLDKTTVAYGARAHCLCHPPAGITPALRSLAVELSAALNGDRDD